MGKTKYAQKIIHFLRSPCGATCRNLCKMASPIFWSAVRAVAFGLPEQHREIGRLEAPLDSLPFR